MSFKPILDRSFIKARIEAGVTHKEIAKEIGCSIQAIAYHAKKIRDEKTDPYGVLPAGSGVDVHREANDNYKKIKRALDEAIDENEDKKVVAQLAAECRKQLKEKRDTAKTMSDIMVQQQWMKAIHDVLAEESPELQRRVIQRLQQLRVQRRALKG